MLGFVPDGSLGPNEILSSTPLNCTIGNQTHNTEKNRILMRRMEAIAQGGEVPACAPRPRWCPTHEQIQVLEGLFEAGMKTPSRNMIAEITTYLKQFGTIMEANVFYWFQNRKARAKRKLNAAHTRKKSQVRKGSKVQDTTSLAPSSMSTIGNNGKLDINDIDADYNSSSNQKVAHHWLCDHSMNENNSSCSAKRKRSMPFSCPPTALGSQSSSPYSSASARTDNDSRLSHILRQLHFKTSQNCIVDHLDSCSLTCAATNNSTSQTSLSGNDFFALPSFSALPMNMAQNQLAPICACPSDLLISSNCILSSMSCTIDAEHTNTGAHSFASTLVNSNSQSESAYLPTTKIQFTESEPSLFDGYGTFGAVERFHVSGAQYINEDNSISAFKSKENTSEMVPQSMLFDLDDRCQQIREEMAGQSNSSSVSGTTALSDNQSTTSRNYISSQVSIADPSAPSLVISSHSPLSCNSEFWEVFVSPL